VSETFNRSVYKEKWTKHRGIPPHINEFYGIATGYSTKGQEVYRAYPYPHATKIRVLPKDFTRNKGFANSHLFGMDKFNAGTSKHITVVEGEEDAASAYYMLGAKFPVVSLPSGTPSEIFFDNVYKYLDSFQEIILAMENDETGNKAAEKLTSIFPGKVSRVSLTKHKDANAFLQAGDDKDFLFAWHNRKKYVPDYLYNTPDQFLDILHNEEMNEFIPTPFSDLNDKIKGLMLGHLTVLTGPEGQGKTEIMRAFEYEILKNHTDTRIGVLHMEESKKTTLISYACYALNKDVRDPDHAVPQADIDKSIKDLTASGSLYLLDFEDDDPFAIFDKVRYLANVCGVKYIFIDPIQQLSYGKEKDLTEEQILSKVSVKLEKMANDLNVCIVLTSHVNDDGQTRSSRMIGKSASVRIDLNRDHLNDDEDVRNTTKLSVSKNRPVGKTGFGGMLKFNPKSFTVGEI